MCKIGHVESYLQVPREMFCNKPGTKVVLIHEVKSSFLSFLPLSSSMTLSFASLAINTLSGKDLQPPKR